MIAIMENRIEANETQQTPSLHHSRGNSRFQASDFVFIAKAELR